VRTWLKNIGETAFGTPRRAAAVLGVYLLTHALTRLLLWPGGLGYDDAEQVLSAQAWAWSYRFEQPPLVTWLLLALRDGLGLDPGLLALTVLRSAMLAALYAFTYLAARRWLAAPLPAAVAAAGLSATYTLGYLAHGDLPHTTALAVAVAASLWLWARLLERPTAARTVAFAIVCGLGLLAKWNYVMVAVGYLIVGVVRRESRALVLSWRTPVVAGVMALMAAPTAVSVLRGETSLAALRADVLVRPAAAEAGSGLFAGLGQLATSALAFPQPWLVLALLVLWPARRRPPREVAPLAWLVVVVLGLHAVLVPLTGAVNFPERWMVVPLLPLPILAVAAAEPADRAVAVLGGVLVVLAVVVWAIRAGIGLTDASYCGKCRTRLPAAAFAAAIREAGFSGGTVVTTNMHLGGNLKLALPEARVVVPRLPAAAWPPPGDGQCVVAWRGDREGDAALEVAKHSFGADVDAVETRRVDAPILGSRERTATLSFRVAPGSGACR